MAILNDITAEEMRILNMIWDYEKRMIGAAAAIVSGGFFLGKELLTFLKAQEVGRRDFDAHMVADGDLSSDLKGKAIDNPLIVKDKEIATILANELGTRHVSYQISEIEQVGEDGKKAIAYKFLYDADDIEKVQDALLATGLVTGITTSISFDDLTKLYPNKPLATMDLSKEDYAIYAKLCKNSGITLCSIQTDEGFRVFLPEKYERLMELQAINIAYINTKYPEYANEYKYKHAMLEDTYKEVLDNNGRFKEGSIIMTGLGDVHVGKNVAIFTDEDGKITEFNLNSKEECGNLQALLNRRALEYPTVSVDEGQFEHFKSEFETDKKIDSIGIMEFTFFNYAKDKHLDGTEGFYLDNTTFENRFKVLESMTNSSNEAVKNLNLAECYKQAEVKNKDRKSFDKTQETILNTYRHNLSKTVENPSIFADKFYGYNIQKDNSYIYEKQIDLNKAQDHERTNFDEKEISKEKARFNFASGEKVKTAVSAEQKKTKAEPNMGQRVADDAR